MNIMSITAVFVVSGASRLMAFRSYRQALYKYVLVHGRMG